MLLLQTHLLYIVKIVLVPFVATTVNPKCLGGSDGYFTMRAEGGTAPYTFSVFNLFSIFNFPFF